MYKNRHTSMLSRGFTLIELSIVLVIIGLLVGGITVGQYLIEVSMINKEITAVQGYAAALNTFRLKYNYLPGDLPNATNFFPVTFNGGSGNSTIDNGVTNVNDGTNFTETQLNGAGIHQASEMMAVNVQLAYAKLINQPTYDETSNQSMEPQKAIFETPTKTGICVYANDYNQNKLRLGCSADGCLNGYSNSAGRAVLGYGCGINAPRAYAIDVKLDDGLPSDGKIFQEWRSGNAGIAGSTYIGCVNTVSSVVYYNASNESYYTGAGGSLAGCPLSMYGMY